MNINNYINRQLPKNQKILKVPFSKKPVNKVNSPYDPSSRNNSISAKHLDEKYIDYCNILPPAPRNQLNNYPQNKPCDKLNPIPYKKNSCYMVDNKAQGVIGMVCNNPGGSNNSNFVRGNEFSNDYLWINQYEHNKIKEYSVERPVTSNENETLVYENSSFYPLGTFNNRQSPWYRTYPTFKNYTAEGLPIYTYPYKEIKNEQIENFSNEKNMNKKSNNVTKMIIIIIFLLVIMMMLK